ncbi:MAG: NIPSNAP family protein [Balneolaceae bacterium]
MNHRPFTPLRRIIWILTLLLLPLTACQPSGGDAEGSQPDGWQSETRAYEMRIYTANEGKLDELEDRFRNYTMALFEEHGIQNVGYWIPDDPERSHNTLIYIISYESREVAEERWDAFYYSAEWQEIAERTNANGNLVQSVESVFMTPTDYSPLQ